MQQLDKRKKGLDQFEHELSQLSIQVTGYVKFTHISFEEEDINVTLERYTSEQLCESSSEELSKEIKSITGIMIYSNHRPISACQT